MQTTAEQNERFAGVKYQLYQKYGLDLFDNWLLMRRDKIERSEVVESLTYPAVREMAESDIQNMRDKIEEIQTLMAEASAVLSDISENTGKT